MIQEKKKKKTALSHRIIIQCPRSRPTPPDHRTKAPISTQMRFVSTLCGLLRAPRDTQLDGEPARGKDGAVQTVVWPGPADFSTQSFFFLLHAHETFFLRARIKCAGFDGPPPPLQRSSETGRQVPFYFARFFGRVAC